VPATFFSFIEKGKTPHWGVDGGKAGLRNYAVVHSRQKGEFEVLKTTGIGMDAGDSVTGIAGGGGGYGDPLERDVEAVQDDIIKGYISIRSAEKDYGVVIDPNSFKVDIEATRQLRTQMRSK
jgi:N-methylhydantoinase B